MQRLLHYAHALLWLGVTSLQTSCDSVGSHPNDSAWNADTEEESAESYSDRKDDNHPENDVVDGEEQDEPEQMSCIYPESSAPLKDYGDTMPNLIFSESYMKDRSRSTFSFEDFYCGEDYSHYESMYLIFVADWCGPCEEYLDTVNTLAEQMEAKMMLPVFINISNNAVMPASSVEAYRKVTQHIDPGMGIIVGLGDSQMPFVFDAGFYSFMPFASVIRKSDMKVIAKENSTNSGMMLLEHCLEVAEDLDSDWESILGTSTPAPAYVNKCEAEDEESHEPNNSFNEATTITQGTYSGGICEDPAWDVYGLEAGNWHVELAFEHTVGNLDLEFYQSIESEMPDASSRYETNLEVLDIMGPGYIVVLGHERASAPYRLTLSLNE